MTSAALAGFENLTAGIYLEGLGLDHANGSVWVSDVVGGGVHGLYPDGRRMVLNPERMWTGGVLVNADGAILSSGQGGIMWNHPETGTSGWLLDRIDGAPINGINEMVPDGRGGIFFGTVDLDMVVQGKPARPTALYRLTREREVIPLADGFSFTNGIMYDQVRRRLYCNDTFARSIVFDVSDTLTLSGRRSLLDRPDVDGMMLDAQGNVWITSFSSGQITRIAPDGTLLPAFDTPASAITQVRFGGADMRDIYIATVPADGGDSLKDGVPMTERKSFLLRGRSEVAGMAIPAPQFQL